MPAQPDFCVLCNLGLAYLIQQMLVDSAFTYQLAQDNRDHTDNAQCLASGTAGRVAHFVLSVLLHNIVKVCYGGVGGGVGEGVGGC